MYELFFEAGSPEIEEAKARRKAKLFKYVDQDESKIDFLLKISYDLTPLGFDYFIAYFLERHYGYTMFVTDGYGDGGIDIKGAKDAEDGAREYIAVQCKRWNVYSINELEMAAFYGRIADIVHTCRCKPYYATTNYLTQNAKTFANEHGITYIDFDSIMTMSDYVTREEFSEYLNRHARNALDVKSQKAQLQLVIDTNVELFQLLKSVRSGIARRLGVPYRTIADDSMLGELIKHKPRTASDLLGVGGFGPVHTEKY